jgi:predicted transcriptional regulator
LNNSDVLISIHPIHAEKIVSGEKRLEFRRSWAARPVGMLVIYATSRVRKIVALAQVKHVFHSSRTGLWNLAKTKGGGISRRRLFSYLAGKKDAFAIELIKVKPITGGIDPVLIFGKNFRPPQSFRYLTDEERVKLSKFIDGK